MNAFAQDNPAEFGPTDESHAFKGLDVFNSLTAIALEPAGKVSLQCYQHSPKVLSEVLIVLEIWTPQFSITQNFKLNKLQILNP